MVDFDVMFVAPMLFQHGVVDVSSAVASAAAAAGDKG